jgi:hypothetical protein
MIGRDATSTEQDRPGIALWKEAGSRAKQLELPPNAHALLLNLAFVNQEQIALDGRSDDGTTVGVSLVSDRPIYHPDPPKWLFDPRSS